MSRPPYPTYPYPHPHQGRAFIVVHGHDILCGRGVNIAQHPGNERFRALVNSRHDESYCTAYTTSEKRAVAEDILKHIKSLDPPGRFLKRTGRSHNSRGLNGPWEQLSDREAVKKTCQALRDCNRADRTGYAAAVRVPEDVKKNVEERVSVGLSNKQHAAAAVASVHNTARRTDHPANAPLNTMKRVRTDGSFTSSDDRSVSLSPSVENAAEWLKKQRIDDIKVSGHIATNVSTNVTSNVTPTSMQPTAPSAVVTTSPAIPGDMGAHGMNAYPSDPMLSSAGFTGHSATPGSLPGFSRSISPVATTTTPSPIGVYDQHQAAAVPTSTVYHHPVNQEYTIPPPLQPTVETSFNYHQYYPASMGPAPLASEIKYSGDTMGAMGAQGTQKSNEKRVETVVPVATATPGVVPRVASNTEMQMQIPQQAMTGNLSGNQQLQHQHQHQQIQQHQYHHQQYEHQNQHQHQHQHHHHHQQQQQHQQQHQHQHQQHQIHQQHNQQQQYQHHPHQNQSQPQHRSTSVAPCQLDSSSSTTSPFQPEEVQRGSSMTGPSGEL